MRKENQIRINAVCETMWNLAMNEYENQCSWYDCVRLKSCKAWVYETEHYYILRSYNTFVAVICKGSDLLIDMLRGVYGYTATSSQHISKFSKGSACGGYSTAPWGCKERYVYREV